MAQNTVVFVNWHVFWHSTICDSCVHVNVLVGKSRPFKIIEIERRTEAGIELVF
jgi:hypothetical protein